MSQPAVEWQLPHGEPICNRQRSSWERVQWQVKQSVGVPAYWPPVWHEPHATV